jgi:hypothetical protein
MNGNERRDMMGGKDNQERVMSAEGGPIDLECHPWLAEVDLNLVCHASDEVDLDLVCHAGDEVDLDIGSA